MADIHARMLRIGQVDAMESILQAREQANQQNCPLLRLPGELRNRIVEYAIISRDPVVLNTPNDSWSDQFNKQALQPALTQTCRQLRREALPIFYQDNTFQFEVAETPFCHGVGLYRAVLMCALEDFELDWARKTFSAVCEWLRVIGKRNRGTVGRVGVKGERVGEATARLMRAMEKDDGRGNWSGYLREVLGWRLVEEEEGVFAIVRCED